LVLKLDIDPRPRIEYLEIVSHKLVATKFMGDYTSVFKGRGIMFESYRDYSQSDDASLIDWKATMRSGKTMVKEYSEEHNLEIFFLVDASQTMVFGSQKRLKHEYAAELVSSMAFAMLERGESVGVGLFSDTLKGFLAPERGIVQYRRILHHLTNPANYDGPCNFAEAMRMCLQRLRPNTFVVLVTDAVGWSGDWQMPLKVANKKFEVIAMLVRDPRDDNLPEGIGHVMVENSVTGQQMLLDTDAIREDYARTAKEIKERNLKALLEGGVADVPVLMTDQDFIKPVIAFFERRKDKWR
jgi:uncharacterized protein (DUF58 family)